MWLSDGENSHSEGQLSSCSQRWKAVMFLSRQSQTWTLTVRPFSLQIWTISIVGFPLKRLTFLPYSSASVNAVTPHTEIPECQRFPGLRSTALSYVHPNIHLFSLESVEVCKFNACRVLLPWNDNCEFVFFLQREGKLQGISGCQNLRSDIVIPAGWPSGVCLKGEGRKKQCRRLNHIFLPIRPCVPTSIITATCFIFSSAVLSDSHPRAMCCSVRPQIP